jgi:ribosomal protein S18 acetylase RimI-like enzyme
VATILLEAFQRKLGGFLGDRPTARGLIRDSIDPALVLAARRDGELVGIACLKTRQAGFLTLELRRLMRRFGPLEGLLRYGFSRLTNLGPPAGILSLDALAVTAGARGLGIGGRLVGAVETFAREHDYRMVSLEVVDTNPRAHSYYQRLGFTVVKTVRVPFFRRLKGFSAFDILIKPVAATIN